MRLIIIGTLEGYISQAGKIALQKGAKVIHCEDIDQAIGALLNGKGADLAMVDVKQDIRRFVDRLALERIHMPVIACGIGTDARAAVKAIEQGAKEYVPLPPDADLIAAVLAAVTEEQNDMIASDPAMDGVMKLADKIAPSEATVLITGESGTGKEVMSQYIHRKSKRASGPFIAVNCAAMDAGLLESELFGHEKGAYAAATTRHLGWFERASGGTLFLDEVSGLPAGVQGKLLRVLESGEFSRLGSDAVLRSDVRLICSTREPLESMVEAGGFRDDLYYRINVVNIQVPPLREHAQDIGLLAMHFLERKALLCNKTVQGFSDVAMQQLTGYTWPGNVRELENVIERAVVLAAGNTIEAVPSLEGPRVRQEREDLIASWLERLPEDGVNAEQLMDEMERRLVETALLRSSRIKARAGRWLGFGERAKDKMRYLCDKHGIQAGGDET